MVSVSPADFCGFITHILVMWMPLFPVSGISSQEGREILMAGKERQRTGFSIPKFPENRSI